MPSGATQGTLEVDWTGNSVLAALTPVLTVGGTGIDNVTVTPSTTGDITLLQDTGLTNSTQQIVGLVGSTSDPYEALAVAPGGSYSIQATFTSDVAPTDTSIDISMITDDASEGGVLVTFAGGSVPGDIEVGDTVSIAGAGVSSYDTTSSSADPMVVAITSDGVVLNLTYDGDSSGGTLSGWTLPQFNATWDIPPPSISIGSVGPVSSTGTVAVTMPVQVSSTLASSADVDLYIAAYDPSQGLDQTENGTLVAKDLTLSNATTNGSFTNYSASTTVRTVFTNSPRVHRGQLDPGDLTAVTGSSGAYSFSGLTPGTTYTVGLALNTGASAIYSFDATAVSGTSVYDIAGDPDALVHVGTLNGGATAGRPTSFGIAGHDYASTGDQVLKLDGETGYLGVPGTSALQPGSSTTGDGGFTFGAWIRGDQALIGGGSPTIAGTITSGSSSGGWSLGLSSPVTFNSSQVANNPAYYTPVVSTADFNLDGKPDLLTVDGAGASSRSISTRRHPVPRVPRSAAITTSAAWADSGSPRKG